MASSIESCGPCAETGNSPEAVRYCTDCEENLCKKCVKHHMKFKLLKTHHLVELSKVSLLPSSIKQNCRKHEEIPLDFYCTQHDITCCRMCMSEEHRSCAVMPLQDAANYVRESPLLMDTIDELGEIEELTYKLIKNRDENSDELRKTESAILQEIKQMKEKIVKHIELSELNLAKDLSITRKTYDDQIIKENSELSDILANVSSNKQDLINLRDHGSKKQLFLALHQTIGPIKKSEDRLQKLVSGMKELGVEFKKNEFGPKSLGSFSHSHTPCSVKCRFKRLQQAQVQPVRTKTLTDFKHEGEIRMETRKTLILLG